MPGEDRLTALLEQPVKRVTGIDFVQIVDPADQTVLRVFFLIDPDKITDPIITTADPPVDVSPETVAIISTSGGERLAQVPVVRATYKQVPLDGGMRTVLEVQTTEPGGFSIYRLTVRADHERSAAAHTAAQCRRRAQDRGGSATPFAYCLHQAARFGGS
jgi:hypothetical protein